MDAEWLFSVRCAAEEVFDQIDEVCNLGSKAGLICIK